MSHMLRLSLFALTVAFVSTPAAAAPPAGLENRVNELMASGSVPGLSLVIVEDGRTVHAQGYGVRRLGAADRVDKKTVFPIGSMTKAMTASALAILVDRKKIGWDDRVIDHLPEFRMHDPWVTREIRVRDLLAHRSGLGAGAGDLLFLPRTTLTRDEILRRIPSIPVTAGFRSEYAYSNILYIVAGLLVERLSGESWERFVRKNLLDPAAMNGTLVSREERFGAANRSSPHARLDGPMHGFGKLELLDEQLASFGANVAPAGGVSSNAEDMGRWLRVQLANGALPDGKPLFSSEGAQEMWTPQTLMPIRRLPAPISDITPQFLAYASGWEVRFYRGHRLLVHGGGVFGGLSYIVLIPEKNVGFVVLQNSEDWAAMRALTSELADHYLGLPKRDWFAAWDAYRIAAEKSALAALDQDLKATITAPSAPISQFAGTFKDPWYGPIRISEDSGGLTINFLQSPGMTGRLVHRQSNTFVTDWTDPLVEPAIVNFWLRPDGKLERIDMQAASPAADFSWDYHDLDFRPASPE